MAAVQHVEAAADKDFFLAHIFGQVVSRQWAIRKTRVCSRWRLWGMRDYNFVQQFLHGCLGAGKITDAGDGDLQ